jgi:hypothetical protein
MQECDLDDILGFLPGAEQMEGVGVNRSRMLGVQLAKSLACLSLIPW